MSLTLNELRDLVPIREVLERMYDISPNRHGMCQCPFDDVNNSTIKIYDLTNMWYCTKCHLGGDIFQFVMRYEKCSYTEAIKLIQLVFKLDELDIAEDFVPPPTKTGANVLLDEFERYVIKSTTFYDCEKRRICI